MSSAPEISLKWPWWLVVPTAVLIANRMRAAIAWLSVSHRRYLHDMITLAIGVAFFYLVLQNYSLFNGWQGLQKVIRDRVWHQWRDPLPIYFLTLTCALAA